MRMKSLFLTAVFILIFLPKDCRSSVLSDTVQVQVRQVPLQIPTYLVGQPDPNPRFYTGRAYQGAKGPVYPYPMLDRLTNTRTEKTYRAVILENEYLELCILPELGGRLFYAVDKTNGYELFYRQHVIKPALIGMLGAWISGGVEWCIPHHHRASTFMPVDYTIERNGDGSQTVWLGELELRHRTRWILGVTLHPGRSIIDVRVKYINRTPWIHSFLYWANVAVHTNEQYQILFPPSTEYATYHGKNQFATWPFFRDSYHGVDYSRGVDLSWWKNHPSPTSLFAWDSKEDFLAGYDHGQEAGVIHVADHHVVPGKKLWTWGTGGAGKRWEGMLTDEDGPYLELMVGAYSDNQPDYSWVQPYEVKTFRQIWYPLRKIRNVKYATDIAAVNVEKTEEGRLFVGCNTNRNIEDAHIQLLYQDEIVHQSVSTISPDRPFTQEIDLRGDVPPDEVELKIVSNGKELIHYRPVHTTPSSMPDPVVPPSDPGDLSTTETLYLTGLRLEQFHNPVYEPLPFYEEALRRDSTDIRINTVLGIHYARRGKVCEAEQRLRSAVKSATDQYTRPRDAEPMYYLGCVLREQGKDEEAYEYFARAAWDASFYSAASFAMAELDCKGRRWNQAIGHIQNSLSMNGKNTKGLNLLSTLLRRTERLGEARRVNKKAIAFDPLDFWARNETVLLSRSLGFMNRAEEAEDLLFRTMRGYVQSVLEIAFDYSNAGLWDEAIDVLERFVGREDVEGDYPLIDYTLGFLYLQKEEIKKSRHYFQEARGKTSDHCFPFRLEMLRILQEATRQNPDDGRAFHYIGNLLYDLQPQKAIEAWETSLAIEPSSGQTHRNLGLASGYVLNDLPRAVGHLEEAIRLKPDDARWYYELDMLYEMNRSPTEKRLTLLKGRHDTISGRDDALSREIMLLVQTGSYDDAIGILKDHHFHTWEGGGHIHDVYVDALLQRGFCRFAEEAYEEAAKDFEAALEYPDNLEVGRPIHDRKAVKAHYYLGKTYTKLGLDDRATQYFRRSAEPGFNTGWHEAAFFQAHSLTALNRQQEARTLYEELSQGAQQRMKKQSEDFFTKFGQKQSMEYRTAQAYYLAGLGSLGMNELEKAKSMFMRARELNSNHRWARIEWFIQ